MIKRLKVFIRLALIFLLQSNVIKIQSTARQAIHLQFDISANALEIRAVQSPKCIVCYAVVCTFFKDSFLSRIIVFDIINVLFY
jgi:hypothetical protein